MDEIKLHLGCGKRFLKGFTHVDLAELPHIDIKKDIRSLPMFKDDSAALIYSSHALEYFDRGEALEVLKEWRRILKPGGTLRLAVPDFEGLAAVYQKYHDLRMILGPLYGRWGIENRDQVVYHKTVYDFNSLKTLLEHAGFINVRRWDWREVFSGEHAGYDDYSQAYIPHLEKDTGILLSLNVECDK